MTIPFLDLCAAHMELRDDSDAAYRRVVDSGWFILSRDVEAFESEFANYCCCRYCVEVGSGIGDVERITTTVCAFQPTRQCPDFRK